MDEMFSDEEADPFEASSDEYELDSWHSSSSYSSKGSNEPLVKKKKTVDHPIASSDSRQLLTRTDDSSSSQNILQQERPLDTWHFPFEWAGVLLRAL
ncbi:unnamed protein product [Acanthoscelides obtectus]|uniref:Uncharacterized protein n=1 Tax=Acanthoscelides obtectus TaxID=200917 RepID=A0A9P0KHZ4_ACAOB|nr:unnamed protein product [Acanthoscelides obtectus]CAK1664225.1 hypothetical protein AOBTE_LOCUS24139 [Acanthoscelides obtectus]